MNPTLAQTIEKAKINNMPQDNIKRAIKRGTGEIEGVTFERVLYEGYGPNGVAIMVDAMTDNRNRTTSDIRHIFERFAGKIGTEGCVNWMFNKVGYILINKDEGVDEDTLLGVILEAGAEDLRSEDSNWEVITDLKDFSKVRQAIEDSGINIVSAEITMFPQNTIKLDINDARKVLKLMDAIEEHDDVQEVYSNFDIPEEVMVNLASE